MRGLSRGPWLIAGLLALGSLTPAVVRAQEWHELYADGQQALRNGQAQRASELFRRAIQRRPQPGVGVPTYGTNFEPRYFPYLRLAEAYLRLGAYEEARKALETSARIGVEPAAERAALESRVPLALDRKQPAPEPTPPPTPASTAAVPPAPPTPTPPPTTPRSEPAIPLPSAPRAPTSPSPSTAPPRPIAPVQKEPRALDITSAPPAARVFIDDEPFGRTDPETGRLRLTGLRPGRHRVRLSLEGHEDLVREVELAGESLAFHGVLPLRPPPPSVPAAAVGTAEPRPSLLRWPVVGLFLVAALVLFLWVRSVSSPALGRERALTPTPRAGDSDRGTDEGLPVEFGEYRLIRRLGKGGMASVYEAERRGERFALKRPLPGFLDDPLFLERFLREAELGRALHHPNIIRIFDRGRVGDIPYFAMELVHGETLRECLDREGRLDATPAARVTAQVAEALDYAHNKGVIHRDLKPSNIMLDGSQRVKVMDYGIARAQHLEGLTTTGSFLGTPNYAAPETVDAVGQPASDVYSLGVVFFEMLTGSLPFRGESAFAVLRKHCTTPPPVPSSLNYALSDELDRIVLRLLRKEPADRPTTELLLNELSDYLAAGR